MSVRRQSNRTKLEMTAEGDGSQLRDAFLSDPDKRNRDRDLRRSSVKSGITSPPRSYQVRKQPRLAQPIFQGARTGSTCQATSPTHSFSPPSTVDTPRLFGHL